MNNIEFLRNGRRHHSPWACVLIRGARQGEGYYDVRSTAFQFPWMVELLRQVPLSHLTAPYNGTVPLVRPEARGHGWLGNMDRIVERCCAFRGGADTHRGSLEGNEFFVAPFGQFTLSRDG